MSSSSWLFHWYQSHDLAPRMVDGTRTQEVRHLEDSIKKLKETLDQQSIELKELTRMIQ